VADELNQSALACNIRRPLITTNVREDIPRTSCSRCQKGVQFDWIIHHQYLPTGQGAILVKRSTVLTAVAAVAVVVILGVAFLVTQSPGGMLNSTTTSSSPSKGTASSTNSIQGGNQTYVATLVTTMQSATSTSTTATSSSIATTSTASSATGASATSSTTYTSTSQSQATGNSYFYTASSQVKVLSVQALTSGSQTGDGTVTFEVTYENIGSSAIYVLEGGGSNLNATVLSGSSLIQQVKSPQCEIAVALVPLSPGAEATALTPGCWSGFHFQLLQPGTIQVLMTLGWSNGTGKGSGSVKITAEFSLS